MQHLVCGGLLLADSENIFFVGLIGWIDKELKSDLCLIIQNKQTVDS